MKSEPDVFSIYDLERDRCGHWDGVRNYQARNNMKAMKRGDLILFYHSSVEPPGVAGLARVCKEAYPDHTSWNPKSDYYDPRSKKDKPLWFMVDVEFVEVFPRFVSLDELKANPALEGMMVIRRGMRLSVQPVEKKHFETILKMAKNLS